MRIKSEQITSTFKKRVDHESRRFRPPPKPDEPGVCRECGAVFTNGRWYAPDSKAKTTTKAQWQPENLIVCPACQLSREGEPRGFLYLKGTFLMGHREEIEHLLRNEAARAAQDNPMARILELKRSDDDKELTITTTTEHLAQRLGRSLEKTFAGDTQYDFSHENKLARVTWQRD
jgi:hypothetical protein